MPSPTANVPEMIYIGLGANLGDRYATLLHALRGLEAHPDLSLHRVSALYRTVPCGLRNQPDFLNAVVELSGTLSPRDLLICLKKMEAGAGRTPGVRWGPRVLDLDIVLFGGRIVVTPQLIIPHCQLQYRRFVLEPLAELVSDRAVPGLGLTVQNLLMVCSDGPSVARLSAGGKWEEGKENSRIWAEPIG